MQETRPKEKSTSSRTSRSDKLAADAGRDEPEGATLAFTSMTAATGKEWLAAYRRSIKK